MDDPRIYFAVERTLLAWIRTSITLIALGFVVARFGIFLDLVANSGVPQSPHKHLVALYIGVGLILVGLVINIVSLRQFVSFKKTLTHDQLPQSYSSGLAVFTSAAMTVICALLVIYLMK